MQLPATCNPSNGVPTVINLIWKETSPDVLTAYDERLQEVGCIISNDYGYRVNFAGKTDTIRFVRLEGAKRNMRRIVGKERRKGAARVNRTKQPDLFLSNG